MRWFVEVSRVGDSTPAERYCLEAKAWQAALQETRKLRGDTGPLSKFSIELLDDGYRAVDPVQKIRYLVNQAPNEAPIVMPPAMNGAAHALGTPSNAPAPVAAPAAVSVAPVAAVSAAPAPVVSVAPVAATVAPVVSVAPAASAPAPAAAVSVAPATAASAPAPAVSVAPATAVSSVVPAAAAPASLAPKPGVKSTAPAAPRPSPRRSSKHPKAQPSASTAPNAAASVPAPTLESTTSAPAPVASVVASGAPSGPAAAIAPVATSSAPIAAAPAVAVVAAPALAVAPSATIAVAAAPVPAVVPAPTLDVAPAPAPAPPTSSPEAAPAPVAAAPVAAAPAQAAKPAQDIPPYDQFVSRTQEPSPEAPIAYRELALAVAPGLAREVIEALLMERLQAMKAELQPRPPGKLVQIAIFDHRFEQRPERPPLGTLAWKDWRGEPVLGFPAFGQSMPPVTNSLPPAAGEAAAAAAIPAEALAPAPTPAIEPSPAESAAPAATPAATEDAEPVPLRKPLASEPDRGSKAKLGRRRRAGEDLISELFDVMHELTFARDIAVGSDFVLNVLNDVLPCEAVLIQVFDINTRNFVVVRGRGGGADKAVLTRTPDSDPLIAEIMRRERAKVYKVQGDQRFSGGRWQHVTLQKREVLAGAVRQGGRYLGMIELCNPIGDAPFHDSEVNALDYICEQYADFVASRPIVLDPDVILPR